VYFENYHREGSNIVKKIFYLLALSLIVLTLIGGSLSCKSSTQTLKWRMATSWTSDNIHYTKGAVAICTRVNQLSNGRLFIEPYPADAIVGAMEVFDAVSKGTVEIGHSWPGYWIDKEPSFELFSSIPDQMVSQEWLVWLYGPSRGVDLWREFYSKYNVVPFPGGLDGPEFGFFTKKPVLTLDDFKGMKLRVPGLAAEVLKELGATPVQIAPGDIKAAMKRGDIDGFEYSTPAVDWPMGFQEVAPYVTLPPWHQPSGMAETIVNQGAWGKLPDDLKAILEAACKEISMVDYLSYVEGTNAEDLDKFKQYGTKINVLDTKSMERIAEITKRLADEKAAKDPFYAKVLKSQRDFRSNYRTWELWGDYKLYPEN
jgi:TRAP-type mannitol/chloroaromatic compound transport system substrate-binding protein